jgi:hypothetical protein
MGSKGQASYGIWPSLGKESCGSLSQTAYVCTDRKNENKAPENFAETGKGK